MSCKKGDGEGSRQKGGASHQKEGSAMDPMAHLPFVKAYSELPKLKEVPWMQFNEVS